MVGWTSFVVIQTSHFYGNVKYNMKMTILDARTTTQINGQTYRTEKHRNTRNIQIWYIQTINSKILWRCHGKKKKINKKLSTHKKKEHEQLKTEQHEHFYKPNVHSDATVILEDFPKKKGIHHCSCNYLIRLIRIIFCEQNFPLCWSLKL